jgi:hypothetical protein
LITMNVAILVAVAFAGRRLDNCVVYNALRGDYVLFCNLCCFPCC